MRPLFDLGQKKSHRDFVRSRPKILSSIRDDHGTEKPMKTKENNTLCENQDNRNEAKKRAYCVRHKQCSPCSLVTTSRRFHKNTADACVGDLVFGVQGSGLGF